MGKIERKLTPAQMRILHATAGSYPEPLTREELAEAAAMSPTSSTFEKYVGQLKTLGLITYPDRGIVRADDRLFP